MNIADLESLAQEALLLALAVSLPAVAISALVGLVVALFQAASQLQDATLAHLPRLIVLSVTLALIGPWMGRQVAAFAARTLAGG